MSMGDQACSHARTRIKPHRVALLSALLALIPLSAGADAGDVAPDCKLKPVGSGPEFALRQLPGKVRYVDFWASWCGPCAQSFPFLNELHRKLAGQGLEIVGINLDENSEDAQAFLAQHPAGFTVATDAGGQCPQDFGVKAMPSSYVIPLE